MTETERLAEVFKQDMLCELNKNSHKGSILDFKDLNGIVTELEYHKAKLFLAIRVGNKGAIREYLADSANYLLALGNLFDVYSEDRNEEECFQINKEVDLFVKKHNSQSSRGELVKLSDRI